MRTLVITTDITFVPQNYEQLIFGLAKIPEVYGLMVIKNRSWALLIQAITAIFSGAAPALGWQLVKNFFTPSRLRRRRHYQANGKKIWFIDDINAASTLEILQKEKIDLLISTRSRAVFKAPLLAIPRLGTVGIHHGLLPEQKGLMCDFWAHLNKHPCGFSLHEITGRFEDGAIIRRVQVPPSESSYLEYLNRASLLELAMLKDFFKELVETGRWKGANTHLPIPFYYRKNPTLKDFYELKKTGLII